MGSSHSSHRRTSTGGTWIPTLKFQRVMKGRNVQQDEHITWMLQIYRDDSFMFKQETTVKVPQRFGAKDAPAQKETVQELTYYGSTGSVLLADDKGFALASAGPGSAYKHLFAMHSADEERKKARNRGELALELLRPFFLVFRTQRVEFKKRHQRPSHIHDNDPGRKKSVIVPPNSALVVTVSNSDLVNGHLKPNALNKVLSPAEVPEPAGGAAAAGPAGDNSVRENSTSTSQSLPLEEEFDWEWECDGIIDELALNAGPIAKIFPPRVLDTILQYYAPDEPSIVSAQSQGPLRPPASSPHLDGPEDVKLPTPRPLPPDQKKKNPTDADFLASITSLRLFAEIPPRTDFLRLSFQPIVIKPAQDKRNSKQVDPDVDVNLNYIKEPLPEPVAPPVLSFGPTTQIPLDKTVS